MNPLIAILVLSYFIILCLIGRTVSAIATAITELSKQIRTVKQEILDSGKADCAKICEQIDTRVLIDLATMKTNIENINRHSNDVSIQQKDLLASISRLYFQNGENTQQMKELEEKNAQLEARCAALEKELQKQNEWIPIPVET